MPCFARDGICRNWFRSKKQRSKCWRNLEPVLFVANLWLYPLKRRTRSSVTTNQAVKSPVRSKQIWKRECIVNNNDQGKICLQQQGSQALTKVSGKPATSDELPVNNNRHQANEEDRGSQQATTEARKKPTVSSRKVEANRRNSLKSTGPKTPNGKKTVARNALKHGFFSKSLLIQHPDGKENQAEYEEFYAALREDSRPIGFREELSVERLAISSWRQHRLFRFERGQVTQYLAEHSHDL